MTRIDADSIATPQFHRKGAKNAKTIAVTSQFIATYCRGGVGVGRTATTC